MTVGCCDQTAKGGAKVQILRALCLALAIAALPLPAALAKTLVDLELVLAIDTSGSVDMREYRLQMEGVARAFRDPAVIAAIRGTGPAGIAVTVMHWSSSGEQHRLVPWMQIRGARSAAAFASRVRASMLPRRFSDSTGVGDALLAAERLIASNRFEGRRKSIDISGDGINNSGIPPELVRDAIVAAGVTINGLAILNEQPHLHRYYLRHVIGGAGAFVMTVARYDDIIAAMRVKLLREISISIAGPDMPQQQEDTFKQGEGPWQNGGSIGPKARPGETGERTTSAGG
ncbi:MAG: DUF1194 domain-containing protein [Methyloligellaceae bacterium]